MGTTMVPACGQKAAYLLYRAVTRAATPLVHLHVHWRRLRRLEHQSRWPERLGRPSAPYPPHAESRPLLLWFHAVSLGEGLSAIPLIAHSIRHLPPHFTVLFTTTTLSAFEVIKDQLPDGVIYQFAPVDLPGPVEDFLRYWNPIAIFLMESELWPNLIISASEKGIMVALLNGRISARSFERWSMARPLISYMLSKLSLLATLSTTEAIRFQLLQAPLHIIHFAPDLKYAVGDAACSESDNREVKALQMQIANRPIWMAASIHRGEEEVMLWVLKKLLECYPDLLTIIVTRQPQHGKEIAKAVEKCGLKAKLRSRGERICPYTRLYIVDTLGELRKLYRVTPIAVVGGSFLPNLSGHNLSEAAAARCAVLTGPHLGHFSHMLTQMQKAHPSSVLQVTGKLELVKAINKLLRDKEALVAHRNAAETAYKAMSDGIVSRVWDLINTHVIKKAVPAA